MNDPVSDTLQKTLEAWQHSAPCLGANVAIHDSKNGYWSSASGFSDLSRMEKLAPDERFYVYSLTKLFTSIVVMRLVENGVIALDDPIGLRLPYLSLSKEVTIRRLLNHTSGVPSYTDLSEYMPATMESPSDAWSFEHVIDLTCKGELDFPPGEQWHYSNTGYMLLLLMIETVTGASFSKNVESFIAGQIGLKNTYVAEKIDTGRITKGYCRYLNHEGIIENITSKYDPGWCKTGLIVSTSAEITMLYHAFFSGQLVNPASLKVMTDAAPVLQIGGSFEKKLSYGFGLIIDPEEDDGGLFGHGGDGPGFNAWTAYYPSFHGRSIIVTILSNTSCAGHPMHLTKEFLTVLADA